MQMENKKRVEELTMSDENLSSIPEDIFGLEGLKSLDVSCNSINDISSSIKKLKALEKLDLSSNEISVIPEYLGEMTHIIKETP